MDEEELILNDTLIKKCEEEGIVIALVAINRETKEIELPQNLNDIPITMFATVIKTRKENI